MNRSSCLRMVSILLAIVTLAISLAPLGAAPAAFQPGAAASPASPAASNEIKLVAQDMIELAWDPSKYPHPEEKFKRWELFRSTSPDPIVVIASGEDDTTDFFRNIDLDENTTYYYRLEIVRCVAPCTLPEHDRRYAIFSDSATTGVFQGTVTRDLTLSGGIYEIGFGGVVDSAVVEVAPGASLAINGGAVVKADPGLTNVGLRAEGGYLYLDQVSFQDTAIAFGDYYDPATAGGGWVRGSTIQNGSIQLYSSNHVLIDQNQGDVFITADHQADAAITHNTFEGAIEINRQASAVISYNTLTNSDIEVSGSLAEGEPKARVLIANNTLINSYESMGVSVDDGASLTLTDNTIQWTGFHGSEASILVGAYSAGTTLVAQRNSLSGGKIVASWGANVEISDNVLLGGGSAITIGCVFCGTGTQAAGSIERNTVQSGWGLEMWAGSQGLLIQHNCIRDNDPGLTLDDAYMTTPLDVRYNYWGSDTGPTHPTNDGGTGDRIEGNQVLFEPWDTTDAYCRAEPPSPPDVDLSVEQVSMIQVIEGVDTLVEAKPLAVKAVISSKNAVAVPVGVRLSYGGATYDSFYEYRLDLLHPSTQQLYQPAAQVTFLEAGLKTVYFFPAEAPFGSSATAQMTVDPASQVKEMDETNNSRSATQPVVKTYWGNNPQDQTLKLLYVPIDPDLLPNNRVYLAHLADQTGLADMLPLAPIDFLWQPDKNPPKAYTKFCLEDTKKTAGEIAKEEYRGLKLAYPDFHRFLVLTRSTWFRGGVFIYCTDYLYPTQGHLFAVTSSVPQVIFIEDYAWEEAFESAAGVAHSYGLPVQNKPILVRGGLEVDTRRIVDNSVYQALGEDKVLSLIGGSFLYGKYGWIDAANYKKLLELVDTPVLQNATSTTADGLVIVSGVIGVDEQVQLDPLFYLPAGVADTPPPGSYAISLLDGSNTVLYSQDFAVSFESLSAQPITQTAFAFALPSFPDVEKVIITKDDAPIGTLQTSANAPQVQVTSPNGSESLSGEHTITWSGTDLDGDPLTYAVLYSPDGSTKWETLAIDLITTSFIWNTDDYPGTQGSGRIKVLVSDSFLTGEDLSDSGFSVENKPPIVGIQQPFSGAAVTYGDSIHLEGLVLDPEDGWLEGASLQWSSNINGQIGSGTSLDPVLGYGEHTITLQATDSLGLSASDSINITVTDSSDPDLSLNYDLTANMQDRAVCQANWMGVQVTNIVADTYARVEFYDGSPELGGRLIGWRRLYAEANSLNETGLEWVPGSPGVHAIYIRVSATNATEANTSNNQVILDLQVGEGTCPVFLPLQERR